MAELFPDDQMLLALTEDADTGVPYIPTGLSPYYLEFRRLLYRLLRTAERANDLRVYQDGALAVGVRPGRCVIASQSLAFAGTTAIAVPPASTTMLWLDATGTVRQDAAFPANRSTFVPLAEITTDTTSITDLVDRRGEAFLHVADTGSLGINVSAAQINAALDGAESTVDADALNRLTGGSTSTADVEHRHLRVDQYVDGEAMFTLYNGSTGADANTGMAFAVPQQLSGPITLLPDTDAGFLTQRYGSATLHLLAMSHLAFNHEGDLTASQSGKLVGVVPIDGVVHDIVLTVGSNIVSDDPADGVTATTMVNGVAATTTDPSLSAGDGSGHRSTAQGDGTPAAVTTDGTEQVGRGDVITVDLTRTANGTISSEASDVMVLVIIQASRPI